jgi:hypothetical protein
MTRTALDAAAQPLPSFAGANMRRQADREVREACYNSSGTSGRLKPSSRQARAVIFEEGPAEAFDTLAHN